MGSASPPGATTSPPAAPGAPTSPPSAPGASTPPPSPPGAPTPPPSSSPTASDPARSDGIPRAVVSRRRRRTISLVWVIPLVAVLIGIYLVVHYLRTQGTAIEIQFRTAEGLEAGKTKIKYKNVDVGTVQTIRLGPDKKAVVVTAQMTRNANDLLVEDTRFWIVKPRIAGGQISGLTTLLSGSYIGMDVGKSTESRSEFTGLDVQPAVTTDEPGRQFLLHAADIGSLDIGSPVFFRRFAVGEVTGIQLDPDGKGVTASIFIHAPNEKYVTQNTRFWQASGVDFSIDGGGVKVSTQSLLSVVLGGVAFQSPAMEDPGPSAANDTAFALFDDERSAMKRSDSQLEKYVAYFNDSVRGLTVGAQVEFRGFVIGEVRSIEMEFDREKREFRFPVEYVLYRDVLPARIMRTDTNGSKIDLDELYQRSVEKRGLRAQLRTSNLLTGQKFVAIDFFKDAPPLRDQPLKDKNGTRVMPTVGGSFDELQETLSNIAKKIDRIPFEQLASDIRNTLKQMQTTMKGADRLLANVNENVAPELTATLDSVKKTMRNAEDALATDAPLQQDLRGTLVELNRAASSLRLLTDYLQRHPESLLRGKAPDIDFSDLPRSPSESKSSPSRSSSPAVEAPLPAPRSETMSPSASSPPASRPASDASATGARR